MKFFSRHSFAIAALLLLPLLAILLTTLACVPLPVGDPEKSVVDKDLVGAWELIKADSPQEKVLVTLQPLNAKTYFVQYFAHTTKAGKISVQVLNFQGWLTTIAGKTFICLDFLGDERALNIEGNAVEEKPVFVVAAYTKEKDKVQFQMLSTGDDINKKGFVGGLFDGVKTREEFEARIGKNIDNKELLDEAITFRKLGKDDLEMLRDIRKAAAGN